MTQSAKLHHNERVIQASGLILMFSPLANFVLSVLPVAIPGKWTLSGILILAQGVSLGHWVLWCASFFVGALMLKGRRSSWVFVLLILGCFIIFEFLNFRKSLQRGWWQPMLSMLANLFVFGAVYLQEFRQSSVPKRSSSGPDQSIAKESLGVAVRPEILWVDVPNLLGAVIEFEGHGPWGNIVVMNEDEIHIESFREPPADIRKRTVEIDVSEQRVLVLNYSHQAGNRYVFICKELRLAVRTAA